MDKFPLSPVPILGPMQDSADFCRPLAAISGVEIKLEIVDQCREAILQSNALRLQQVLINLCSNAIKYTCSGTTILVSSKLSSRQDVETMINNSLACGPIEDSPAITTENSVDQVVVFSVRDEGAGISPGQEKKMFWKISQLDSDLKNKLGDEIAGQPTGTGLGLNLCLKFVQLLGGNIWVTNNTGDVDASSRNGGSTFSFYIPLDSFGNSNNKKVGATLDVPYKGGGDDLSFPLDIEFQSEKEAAAKSSKFEVLLVDDALINRKVFERMLKKVDRVKTIVTADSAKTALELLEQNTFNIIISDVQMPGMDGPDLAKVIIGISGGEVTPIIVGLTADTSERVTQRCRDSGMKDVIYKPINLDEMKMYFNTTVDSLMIPE